MSAHDQIRNMLDQLMGTGRDGEAGPDDHVPFHDPRVCRSFLLGCCPHDVLSATRMDMGDCPKIHRLALRADYEKAQKDKDHYYDVDAWDHLERFFDECDRKTEIAKQRLIETQEELSAEAAEKADKVLELNENIGKTLAEAELQGTEGNVEESLKLMEQVEALKKEKFEAENDYRNSMPASSYQQQKLRVCEICSAYLGVHDNDRRLADHFGGKLHMGFVFLREKLEQFRVNGDDRKKERDTVVPQRKRDGRRRYSRSRSRSRSRNRDRRSRDSRNRSRSRERRRRRSRSGSRQKKKRSRSRSNSRDRSRQSNKRDRKSSSRSKGKKRDPSSSPTPDAKSGSPRNESNGVKDGRKSSRSSSREPGERVSSEEKQTRASSNHSEAD